MDFRKLHLIIKKRNIYKDQHMKIIDYFIYKKKANELLKLNKPIELMNDEELSIEFNGRLKEINKAKTIDDRSNKIIEHFLKRITREKETREQTIINIFSVSKSFELRQEILSRYSIYIDEENLDKFIRTLQNIETDEAMIASGYKFKNNPNKIYKAICK